MKKIDRSFEFSVWADAQQRERLFTSKLASNDYLPQDLIKILDLCPRSSLKIIGDVRINNRLVLFNTNLKVVAKSGTTILICAKECLQNECITITSSIDDGEEFVWLGGNHLIPKQFFEESDTVEPHAALDHCAWNGICF